MILRLVRGAVTAGGHGASDTQAGRLRLDDDHRDHRDSAGAAALPS